MFDYVPDVFRKQYAETEEEADRWYTDPDNNRRPPELLPRDEVARSINSEVKAGRGTPHGGVFLDIATRLSPEEVRKRLPSMYHQFKELADVDITAEPMEVGPTCHYVMGGVEVDPDTAASVVPGLFAAGEVGGGMHGSNRLGGNSLSDLLVFGRRAGLGAAEYVDSLAADRPDVVDAEVQAARSEALAPLEHEGGENPYSVHADLQQTMNDLVGIIRRESEVEAAIEKVGEFRARLEKLSAPGSRIFNPGWHLAIDLRNMLLVSDCVAKAALERQESRGGHTREDYPAMSPEWRKINLVCSLDAAGHAQLARKPVPTIRRDLLELFDVSELKKYMTDEELVGLPGVEAEAADVAAAVDAEAEAEPEVKVEPEVEVVPAATEPEAEVEPAATEPTAEAEVESASAEPESESAVDIPVQNEPGTDTAEKTTTTDADAEGGAQ
jgi:succinate dehydrogenase / fumarate reductase flavoprotein subunit